MKFIRPVAGYKTNNIMRSETITEQLGVGVGMGGLWVN
jgi:hypothetical protein